MANHALPTLTSTYTNFVTEVSGRIEDSVRQNRSDTVTLTNPPVGTIRWNTTSSRWEANTGTVGAPVWSALTATYGISITGDAGTVDGKDFGTFTAAGGILYATSTTAAAATAAGTAGTVLTSGGAGAPTWTAQSSLNAGQVDGKDFGTFTGAGGILYATSTTAAAGTGAGTAGQVLTSGGAGAPTWTAQSSLSVGSATTATTAGNVSGTVAIANGGTGATTAAQGRINLAVETSATGSTRLAVGTTAQRDVSPAAGFIRFNTSLTRFEGWNGAAWAAVGGGATGGGTDDVFVENGQTVNTNYTIRTNKNAMSAGPVTIASGITVTVPSGSNWAIV
jgi:hypothetical protein